MEDAILILEMQWAKLALVEQENAVPLCGELEKRGRRGVCGGNLALISLRILQRSTFKRHGRRTFSGQVLFFPDTTQYAYTSSFSRSLVN